jgi:hypothetical protein
MARHSLTGSLLLTTLLAGACKTSITLPNDFVELGDRGEGLRAVTADDARLRVRTLGDPTEGSIEFWSETLRNDLVQQRGYELVNSGEVQDGAGQSGRWLEFATNVRGERIGLLVAIWVRQSLLGGPSLQVVEFAAREPAFGSRVAAVRQSLASVR